MSPTLREPATPEGLFVSTRWTLVLAAGETDGTAGHAHRALSELCRVYWPPLYLFLRRKGYPAADAQDLTQGLFADLIATRSYARADRSKGRFRSFLLGALKHFVADERARAHAQKRGGGKFFEPLDENALQEVEAQVGAAAHWHPDAFFEREWAAALLRQTLNRLDQECAIAGKTSLYDAMKAHVALVSDEVVPYAEISIRLRRPIATLRSDLARMRGRYRAILREEVGSTVAQPAEVDDELRYLCQVIAVT